MKVLIALKFWHPKSNQTWSNREKFFVERIEEACFCCEDFVNEFLSAGWRLKKHHIVVPENTMCESCPIGDDDGQAQ